MTKKAPHRTRGESEAPKAPTPASPKTPAPEAAHQWRGGGVEPGTSAHESAEDAATRAEGNAPFPATAAKAAPGAAGSAAATGPEGGGAATATPEALADEAENAEEKRQAAVEEHAEQPVKHAPHGRL